MRAYSALGVAITVAGVVWLGCSSDEPSAATSATDAGADSGGSTDAGSSPTADSGGNTTDSGVKPTTTITYGQCAAFTKCGGDVVGSWKVTGGCLSQDQFADAKAQCQGLQESNVVIKADGTVTVTATRVMRNTVVNVTGKVLVPKSCAPLPSCAVIAGALQVGFNNLKFDTATCTESGDSCDCAVERTLTENTDDAYTTDNGTLTTENPTRTFDYCVTADKNVFQETTAGASSFQMFIEITKQ